MKRLALFVLILIAVLTVPSFVSTSFAQATNTINSVTVAVPACGGFAGRIAVNYTIDGVDNWLRITSPVSGMGSNVGIAGAGTYTNQYQYIPTWAGSLPNGTMITVQVDLTNVAETVTYDSKTINFICDTGQIVTAPPPSNNAAPATIIDNPANPPDARLNWHYGDLNTAIFANGDGAVVYCYTNGNSWLAFDITSEIVNSWDSDNSQETPVLSVDNEGCRAAFYILDSGEYQINIWTDDGKLYEIIADNLNFDNATLNESDPNEVQ